MFDKHFEYLREIGHGSYNTVSEIFGIFWFVLQFWWGIREVCERSVMSVRLCHADGTQVERISKFKGLVMTCHELGS